MGFGPKSVKSTVSEDTLLINIELIAVDVIPV